jgi:hypothetical protein
MADELTGDRVRRAAAVRDRLAAAGWHAAADGAMERTWPGGTRLRCALQAVDLAPLAGHPTLRAVAVRAPHAVDIAPLQTAPRLLGLDLGGSQVRDLAVLGGMRRLRYLALRYERWRELWRRDVQLPRLAVAVLDGDPSPSTIAAWTQHLPGDAGGTAALSGSVRHFIGQFEPRG